MNANKSGPLRGTGSAEYGVPRYSILRSSREREEEKKREVAELKLKLMVGGLVRSSTEQYSVLHTQTTTPGGGATTSYSDQGLILSIERTLTTKRYGSKSVDKLALRKHETGEKK